jgi:hypothetical protein
MVTGRFQRVPSLVSRQLFFLAALLCSTVIAEAQNQPSSPLLGVFREANKPPSNPPSQPNSQPRPQQPIEAPLGNPQWQPKNPAASAPQGNAGPAAQAPSVQAPSAPVNNGGMPTGEWGANVKPSNDFKPPQRSMGVAGAHNIPEPPVQEPPANSAGAGLGSIGGIIPGFASSGGFGGVGGIPGAGGLGGGLAGGALGGALLGGGIQGLFSGLNPQSIMQIGIGAGMLLSQMGQQQSQGQTSQNNPTPTPSPTIRP